MNTVTTTAATYPIAIENFGVTSLDELFDDWVIYRSLEPVTRRLSGLKAARYQLGLPNGMVPRKQDDEYARVALWICEQAQELRRASFDEFLLVGDTLSGDGYAFQSLQRLSGLPGVGFIGDEKADRPEETFVSAETGLFVANRWSHLAAWLRWGREQGLKMDRNTVVIIDMDKTAIGARGRNDRAIDAARLKGLYRTVGAVLGDRFDAKLFEQHYDTLNQAQYHHITEDNQDYLAYICLVLNNGAIDCVDLMERMDSGAIDSFSQFVRYVQTCIVGGGRVSEAMRQAHEAVNTSVAMGDPTPFKHFRREEFLATIEHMNNLPDDVPPAARLAREITITQEVREAGLWLRERGCLVLSLSDKPDEASLPHRTRHRGMPPVHRAETHAVGVSIEESLRQWA